MGTVVADPMLTSRRTDILRIAARYGIENVRVFGSFARGKNRPDSDLDLLVDLEPGRSLLDIIAAKQDLEDLLKRSVDVVTERSLSPYFRDSVTQEVVYL
jgi:Predicted nucleotidyltransferases